MNHRAKAFTKAEGAPGSYWNIFIMVMMNTIGDAKYRPHRAPPFVFSLGDTSRARKSATPIATNTCGFCKIAIAFIARLLNYTKALNDTLFAFSEAIY